MASFSEMMALRERITFCERKIKKLESLLIHHIHQAQLKCNDVNKKEKHYQAVKQENDTLRARLCELEKKLINQRHSQNPASSATSNLSQQGHHQSTGSQLLLNNNNDTELLIPSSRTNTILLENDMNNTFRSNNDIKQESESLDRASPDLVVTSILDSSTPLSDFILDNPQTLEMDTTEDHNDALYSVATTKSNPVISKMPKNNRKTIETASSIGRPKIETVTKSLDRASPDLVVTSILDSSTPLSDFNLDNPQTLEMDTTEDHNDGLYSVATTKSDSVISKMPKNNRETIGTANSIGRPKIETVTSNQYAPAKSVEREYKKANKITIKPSQDIGCLTERLQLIAITPVGEDPYQMREADLREPSPITKLMLQKSNHDRIKICPCENVSNNTESTRIIYDPVVLHNSDKNKQNRFNTQHSDPCNSDEAKKNKKNRSAMVTSPCLDIVKTEPGIDWSIYSSKSNRKIKTSVCDYSYGESSSISNNDEVPRWRENVYSPLTLPGNSSSEDDYEMEAIDDAAFEKRHQKYETMERRQLKYHLRHIREHWSRGCASGRGTRGALDLARRQRRSLASSPYCLSRTNRMNKPVPFKEFKLPWVRSSKSIKRSKRS